MTTGDLEQRIGERLAAQRRARGWSLADLAERSGVSKSMIARIERGETSPTAGLLGRLCAGLGSTLSALIAAVEQVDARLWTVDEQPVWTDGTSGVERRTLAAPLAAGGVDVTRITLRPEARITYDLSPTVPIHQYLVLLAGRLEVDLGDETFQLAPGDCLGATIDRPTAFRVPPGEPAEYLVIADRGTS